VVRPVRSGTVAVMPEVHDPLLEVLDEAPEDEEVPTAREEQGANQAVAEYRRGDARESEAVVQPGPHGWRILVTPEARHDLEQRDRDIQSIETAIRAKDPVNIRQSPQRMYMKRIRLSAVAPRSRRRA
jgi:hypothetical protein